ncbi:MAG: hypothetical protein FJW19_05280 [Actinobacteria bacterium]|nr:hypothetical protein [Actinomycetota bacterium]
MFSTNFTPVAIASVRMLNMRAFKSFRATKSFVDYSTERKARHLEGLLT